MKQNSNNSTILKLSTFSNITILVLVFSVVFFVIFNFSIYRPLQGQLIHMEQDIKAMLSESQDMTYPLQAVANIRSLPKGKRSEEKIQKLFNGFADELIEHSDTISGNISKIQTKLNEPLFKFFPSSAETKHSYLDLLSSINSIENTFIPYTDAYFDIYETKAYYQNALDDHVYYTQLLSAFQDKFDNYLTVFHKQTIWLYNFAFVLLILLSIILSAIILRQLMYQKKIVLQSLESIEHQNFDTAPSETFNSFFKEEHDLRNIISDFWYDEKMIWNIKSMIQSTYEMDDLINCLFNEFKTLMNIDRLGIAFADYSRSVLMAEYGVASYEKILLGPGFVVPFRDTSLTSILTNKKPIIMPDLEQLRKRKPSSRSLNLLKGEEILSNMAIPMILNNKVLGIVFLSSKEKNHFSQVDCNRATKVITEISSTLTRSYLIKIMFSQMTSSFSELVEKRDNETGDHLGRMTKYSTIIAEGLMHSPLPEYKVTKQFVLDIEKHAAGHDIGKVGIPDKILKKPGKLTVDEFEDMKAHTLIGAELFGSIRKNLNYFGKDFFGTAHEIALHHHEKWDGSGYPDGLKGQDIPLSARIVAIADVFDAITSKRVYKDAFALEDAFQIMRDGSGKHFDPYLIDVFFDHIEEIKMIYNNSLDDILNAK